MGSDQISISCDCGFTSEGDPDTVVAETQEHGREVHNMDMSREQIMEMSQPVG
jgi:predicted small metal-binding protein